MSNANREGSGVDERPMNRRGFLGAAAAAAGSLVAVAGGGVSAVYLAVPALTGDGEASGWTLVRDVATPADGGPARATIDLVSQSGWARSVTRQAVFIERRTDGTVTAYSAKCPHQGCLVDWRAAQADYFCVCHSSTWSRDGQLAAGPAKRGLDPLEARVTPTGDVEVKYASFALDTAERVEVG